MIKNKKRMLCELMFTLAVLCLVFGIVAYISPEIAYAGDPDYTTRTYGGFLYVDFNRDCSVDDITMGAKQNVDVRLNGHTVTVNNPFTTVAGYCCTINGGTIKYDKKDTTFGTINGGLVLTNVSFKNINCGCLFSIGENRDGNVIQVYNCLFENCKFNDWGGAFYFDEYDDFDISFENDRFYNCENAYGPMIFVNELWGDKRSSDTHSKLNMSGCVFDSCKNTYDQGSCIYINAAYVDVGDLDNEANNLITNCSAKGNGGAIYIDDGNGYGLIKGFVFTGNKSEKYGGAVFIGADGEVVDNCIFIENSCGSNYYGGAIYIENSKCKINDCCFAGNTACYGGAIYNDGTNEFTNCLFCYDVANNGAKNYANEIYNPTDVSSCHFYNKKDGESNYLFFEDDWGDYYGVDSYINSDCTANNPQRFLDYAGWGTKDNPFKINDERLVYDLYVALNHEINPSMASYYFDVTKNGLIWFKQIQKFRGQINGGNNNLYLPGNMTSLVSDNGKAYNYTYENRNGTGTVKNTADLTASIFSEGSTWIIIVVAVVAVVAVVLVVISGKKRASR